MRSGETSRWRAHLFTAPGRVAALLGMLFCLTGCPSEPDADPTPQPPPKPAPPPAPPKVPQNIADTVISNLFTKRNLKFKRPRDQREKQLDDQHRGYFIRRRIRALLELNPGWGSNLTLLSERVEAELIALEAYELALLAPTRLGGAVEVDSPPRGPKTSELAQPVDKHLNLEDAAYATIHTTDAQARLRTRQLVQLRRRRVKAIIWRAAAIDDQVWSPSGSQLAPSAALVDARINELLDRRLRAVERMATQVATHNYINGGFARANGETEPTAEPPLRVLGPEDWRDDFRGRPFEYPRVQARPAIVQSAVPSGIAASTDRAFREDEPATWRFGKRNTRLEYNVPPAPGIRLRSELLPHWRQRYKEDRDDSYDVNLVAVPPVEAADAVDMLWRSQFNWWDRSWLYCDHVLSALHVEALLFAMRRMGRLGEFNEMGRRLEFIQLSSHVNERDERRLMSGDSTDPFFGNIDASEGDLQVGDQLIMWNSFIYSFLADGEWQLENALIVDLVSDPHTGGIFRNEMSLQGHGTQARHYPNYQKTIVAPLTTALKTVQAEIAQHASETSFEYHPVGSTIVKWEPFEPFEGLGAWWLVIPFPTRRINFQSFAEVRASIPRAIEVADVPSPTQPFPLTIPGRFLLFPLFEPKFKKPPAGSNAWLHYFVERAKPAGARPFRRLQPVTATGDLLPTLFRGGKAQPLLIVRPKAST